MPVKIFISCPQQQSKLRDELVLHLAPLVRGGKVEYFYDGMMIPPETPWEGHGKRTAPMPSLGKSNIHKIVELLTPLMERENERRALLILALGHDAPLLHKLDFTGTVEPFLVNMIKALVDYGEATPGKQALWALLDVVRERVGVDREARIDALYPVINALGRNDDQGRQEHNITTADIVLLLICPHFFVKSEYCFKHQLPVAMARYEAGQAVVIPILVRQAVGWKEVCGLGKLDALPKNASPVTGPNWKNRDEAWLDVVFRLEEVVEDILKHGISPEPLEAAFAGADLILEPFSRVSGEIKNAIGKADHVWLLCRTGLGLWRDFRSELDPLFIGKKKSKNNRLLVLDPQSEAFSSTRFEWIPWHFQKEQTFEEYQETAEKFLRDLCKQSNEETIKALNITLPLMVLIVNPKGGDNLRTLMLVEYPTNGTAGKFVHGGYQVKPCLKISPQEHESFYQGFLESFEELWRNAKTPEPCSNLPPSG